MALSQRWREIAGESNWVGLLDPIDPLLRSELVRYAEMSQACYDSFDYNKYSRYCGSCKYTRSSLFQSIGMENFGYDVTRYLYATWNTELPNFMMRSDANDKWSDASNWMGYVAVSNDETSAKLGRRDIAIAWRGTVTVLEWLADVTDYLTPVVSVGIQSPDKGVEVQSGFIHLYTEKQADSGGFDQFIRFSAREQILAEMSKLIDLYTSRGETVSISVTGHSLGSALAILSAYDIAETILDKGKFSVPVQTTVYSFSSPRVGNESFKKRFEDDLGIKAIRVVYLVCEYQGEGYKLFWPEKSEFIRMASRFGATIVPFGAVGEDDFFELALDFDDLANVPFHDRFLETINNNSVRLRDDASGELKNQHIHVPVMLPKIPGRLYLHFGKPIRTQGRENELKCKEKEEELYLTVKSEVEGSIDYLKKKREKDPYRNILPRLVYKAAHGFDSEVPTFDL